MNNTLLDLAQLIDDDPKFYTIASNAVPYNRLRRFIVEHLSVQQRQVYDIIKDEVARRGQKPGCSSAVIEIALDMNRHQSSNIVRYLVDLKLVCRDKQGGVYRYRVTK